MRVIYEQCPYVFHGCLPDKSFMQPKMFRRG
jgi:hypothetical protein